LARVLKSGYFAWDFFLLGDRNNLVVGYLKESYLGHEGTK
jgi:hypothetical protein